MTSEAISGSTPGHRAPGSGLKRSNRAGGWVVPFPAGALWPLFIQFSSPEMHKITRIITVTINLIITTKIILSITTIIRNYYYYYYCIISIIIVYYCHFYYVSDSRIAVNLDPWTVA